MSRNDLDSTERASFEAFRVLVVKTEVKTHNHVHWDRHDRDDFGTDGGRIQEPQFCLACLALVVRQRVGAEQGPGEPGPAWTRVSSTRKFNSPNLEGIQCNFEISSRGKHSSKNEPKRPRLDGAREFRSFQGISGKN